MNSHAVVFHNPGRLAVSRVELTAPAAKDVVVAIDYSGISTGTERLLWNGQMPVFPGMGYPLVPGYESVGRVIEAEDGGPVAVGTRVFVPGARCFGEIRGLFGGSASTLVVPAARVVPVSEHLGAQAVLLALAATAYHAVAGGGKLATIEPPELIVGHGVLGRLLARLTVAAGLPAPTVWELDPRRSEGATGYRVMRPQDDDRRDYRAIYDVSGDASLLDTLISRLAPGGEVVLAGFYERLAFDFAPAFAKEARLRVAAEWQRADMLAVTSLLDDRRLSLDGLITHTDVAEHADGAYRTAFGDAACLKMILDWRACA
jgi:bacteriochlorophyllide a dehydrogenase